MSGVETKVVHSPAPGSHGHRPPEERAAIRAEREARRQRPDPFAELAVSGAALEGPPGRPGGKRRPRKGWRTP